MATDKKGPAQRQKAVALKQMGDRADIPRITASGAGKTADKILQIAFENGVKVRTDEDLVEILSAFDVDSYIPLEALRPVSEILSYLYNENIRLTEHRQMDEEKQKADHPPEEEGK